MEITNTEGERVDLPENLAQLLIKNRGWKEAGRRTRRPTPPRPPEPAVPTPVSTPVPTADGDTLNPAATCDDDLPDGITFADGAYTTVVDPVTGEKVRVLKTHCRNGHEYTPGNAKLRLREDKAYRECQTCLKARRARGAARN
jgi:hypothetical protein